MILLLCIKIFLARIIDVSLGVIRTVVTIKGKSFFAAFVAFIEVSIWFLIAREALNTEFNSIWIPFAYAGGFATGTFIGTKLSNVFIKGIVGVQVITDKVSEDMISAIKSQGFGVSIINLYQINGNTDTKKMLFIQINKSKLKTLTNLIKSLDENAFIIVNDTKYVQNGYLK